MDGYLCFNIYKGWMKSNIQVCGSNKEVLRRMGLVVGNPFDL